MTDRLRRAGSLSWALVGLAALIAVGVYLARLVAVIFPPLILAGAIVFILNPVVTMLARRHVPRALGAALSYAGVLGIFVLSGFLLAPLATDQYNQLVDEWPVIQDRGEEIIDNLASDSRGTPFEFTRRELEDQLSTTDEPLRNQLERVGRLGVTVLHFILILVISPIIAFYMLVDVPHLRRVAHSLIPEAAEAEVLLLAERLGRAIGGFFRGQLLIAVLVGVLSSIGLGAIGLKFWFLVGMIAGVFNIIPLIGPWIGGVPAVAIALTTGSPLQAVAAVAILAAVQQVDNHFITPQVMQRAVHLHPAAVILALLAGGNLAGFFGLLLAVPVAAVLKILLGHVWRVHVLGEPLPEVAGIQKADDDDGSGLVAPLESANLRQ